MKTINERIAYYTRKVAERVSHHPTEVVPPNYKYRSDRLMSYKRLMHQQIKASGVKA